MDRRGLTGLAYFVIYPARIEDLFRLHMLTERKPYTVLKSVTLARIDYENFITDMTVERQFLEANAPLCCDQPDDALSCVLVRQRGRKDGVLVVPDALGFVIWAAYLADVNHQ